MIWIILIPWVIITIWWYVGLILYLRHKESLNKTTDFGIKILTLGENESVLRRTVECCSKEPTIITRRFLDLPNSKLPPSDFKCQAKFKGKDLEWARREHPHNYTLYLDEDSLCSLREIPDADIVQFREVSSSDSLLVTAAEAHRLGFQVEQVIFEKVKPLYLWGGGFAVKRWLEDKTTWDRESITEDTGFLFSITDDYSFRYSKQPIYSRGPRNIKDLIFQRWRWASGIYQDTRYLENNWLKVFVYFRIINWGLWTIYTPVISIFFVGFCPWLILPAIQAMVWSGTGVRLMGLNWQRSVVSVLLAPIAAYIHSLGALLALFYRQKRFRVTPKG